MPTTEPIAALQEALAAHLRAALPAHLQQSGLKSPGAVAQRIEVGWPDPDQEILDPAEDGPADDQRLCVLSITAPAPGELLRVYPTQYGDAVPVGDTNVEVLWLVGRYTLDLQLDVWAKSQAQRSELVRAVRVALSASVPEGSQLFLSLADYYGVRASYRLKSTGADVDAGQLVAGRWYRHTVTVEAETDEVVKATHAKLKELSLRYFNPPEVETPEVIQILPEA